MPIRLPDIPQFQPAFINAPGVRLDAAAAQGQALSGVARELAAASSHFHDTAIQIQKIENGRTLSEVRQKLSEAYQGHLENLQKDPDPAARIQKTREFLGLQKQAIEGEEYPQAVRDEALAHFEDFANRAFIEQSADAARLAAKRASLTMQNELDTAKRAGNRDAFETALGTAEDYGVILPEQKDAFMADFERTTNGTALDLAIQEDPALVLQDLERPDFLTRFPGLSQEDIPHLQDAARVSSNRKRGEQLDLIEAALAENKLEPQDIEAADYLNPNDRAKVKQALDAVRSAKPPTPEQHGAAWDALLKLREDFSNPAVTDKNFAARWADTKADVLALVSTVPPAFRTDITEELSRRSPANRSAAKLAPTGGQDKAELKAIGTDRITRARAAGMFGQVDDEAAPPVREKAFRRAEELRLKISNWIEKHPDAGIDEVSTYTDTLISGDRIKTAAVELAPFIPGSAQKLRPAAGMVPLPGMEPGTGQSSAALLPPRQQLESFLSKP